MVAESNQSTDTYDPSAIAIHHGTLLGKIKRDDIELFLSNVLSCVGLGPLRQGENAQAKSALQLHIRQGPQLGSLRSGMPPMP